MALRHVGPIATAPNGGLDIPNSGLIVPPEISRGYGPAWSDVRGIASNQGLANLSGDPLRSVVGGAMNQAMRLLGTAGVFSGPAGAAITVGINVAGPALSALASDIFGLGGSNPPPAMIDGVRAGALAASPLLDRNWATIVARACRNRSASTMGVSVTEIANATRENIKSVWRFALAYLDDKNGDTSGLSAKMIATYPGFFGIFSNPTNPSPLSSLAVFAAGMDGSVLYSPEWTATREQLPYAMQIVSFGLQHAAIRRLLWLYFCVTQGEAAQWKSGRHASAIIPGFTHDVRGVSAHDVAAEIALLQSKIISRAAGGNIGTTYADQIMQLVLPLPLLDQGLLKWAPITREVIDNVRLDTTVVDWLGGDGQQIVSGFKPSSGGRNLNQSPNGTPNGFNRNVHSRLQHTAREALAVCLKIAVSRPLARSRINGIQRDLSTIASSLRPPAASSPSTIVSTVWRPPAAKKSKTPAKGPKFTPGGPVVASGAAPGASPPTGASGGLVAAAGAAALLLLLRR